MTDKEIIQALECCGEDKAKCNGCPLREMAYVGMCIPKMALSALDLIKRQQAEIERLQEIANPKCQQCVEQTRKNGFVEFADLFKQQMRDCAYAEFDGIKYYLIGEEFVNRHLKELTEGSNGE